MKISIKELTDLTAYMRASRDLENWIHGAKIFGLLSTVVEAGILDGLASGRSITALAAATHSDYQTLHDLCLVLEAYGIIEKEGDTYHLTANYALMMSPSAPIPLANKIAQAQVMIHTLEAAVGTGDNYTSMATEDVLAMAQGAGISALSTSPRVGQVTICQAMPEVEACWSSSAYHLEVGCGIGNSLFGTVLAYPMVTATGIEINDNTAQEARQRAEVLGVADRVEIRNMDACDITDASVFDTIQWSQFFFPVESRLPVLRAMWSALKPGGLLFMPWLGSVSDDTAPRRRQMLGKAVKALFSGGTAAIPYFRDLISDTAGHRKREKQAAMIQRLLFRHWGVPVRSAAELIDEVQDGGFKILRVTRIPASQFAMTRGFLLAQREQG